MFYIFGICGMLSFILWMYTIYNTPDQHPRILNNELLEIKLNVNVTNAKGGHSKKQVPWLAIMTSIPVWAISVAKFCGAWGNLMLMSKLPSYLKSILHISIQNVIFCIFFFLYFYYSILLSFFLL